MNFGRKKYTTILVAIGLCFCNQAVFAVLFEPGVGIGLEYTDNAALTRDDQFDDTVTTAYVGASISENEGALTYDATTSFNNHHYTQDTFSDQRYFNLGASTDWEMVKDRFNWLLSDYFNQRPINALNSNTPDNLEDSNVFTFGANIRFPFSARQSFSLVPTFSQYYYEILQTDNKQYSLAANWNYQMFRLTNVGFNLSSRTIDYVEQGITDISFTNLSMVVSGSRQRSDFSLTLGATNVKRDAEEESTGFAGNVNYLVNLSSRSSFNTLASTDLTDTSSTASDFSDDPSNGVDNDVQVTTDVIRNSVLNLSYLRDDSSLHSSVWGEYRKVTYSDNPLDRVIRSFGVQVNYPVTRLLTGGAYVNYNRTKQLDDGRLDKRFTVGGDLKYNFSRKLHGLFDLKYRRKKSTLAAENYDEYSVFVSIVYGFGEVSRPTRAGGF